MTRIKIQDIITDRYLEPSPRALQRRYGYNRGQNKNELFYRR